MKDFINRLTSRKLLLALSAFLVFVANKEYGNALTVILTYLGINGAAEVTKVFKTTTISTPELNDAPVGLDEVDGITTTGKIISGRTIDEHKGDPDWE